MKRYVIIVAGGKGARMGASQPKQFISVGGRPVLMHTIKTFYDFDPSATLIVVLPANQISTWKKLCKTHTFTITHRIIDGGETRFDSVRKGLSLVKEQSIVAIHDGVRPLVSDSTLEKCFSIAEQHGTAIPVIPVTDSLRKVDTKNNNVSMAVDRSQFVAVQTPQVFQSTIIQIAYKQGYDDKFTDDASVVESLGIGLSLVEGNRENIKITTAPDLQIAELFLVGRKTGDL